MMMSILRIAFAILATAAVAGIALINLRHPSNDRDWLPEYARTATADIGDDKITLHNARDWTYDANGPLTQDWMNIEVDPDEIQRAWFVIEPFGAFEGIGHTFLSFELADGSAVSFSIQARQENGEQYSAMRGLMNEYELAYQWGTERDFIALRLIARSHDLRMYPLTISKEDAQGLFKELARKTNELAEAPRFYNTFTANCTNLLAKIANGKKPGSLPYGISWNLTGYADLYLMKYGFIENSDGADAARDAADLVKYKDAIAALASMPARDFSAGVRALLAD